jgi:hypothetical protein
LNLKTGIPDGKKLSRPKIVMTAITTATNHLTPYVFESVPHCPLEISAINLPNMIYVKDKITG